MQRASALRILVPRHVDVSNFNAQNLNAKAFLKRFRRSDAKWLVANYHEADPAVVANPNVEVTKLLPRRAWRWHMAARYLKSVDAIFYANKESYDTWGLALRKLFRRRVPLILTLEGLTCTPEEQSALETCAGHPIACFPATVEQVSATRKLYQEADHIIAISPFMAKMGKHIYGDKVSIIPLGVDLNLFKPTAARETNARPIVLSAGTVYARKRPEVFLQIAQAHPTADFRWIGEGELRTQLIETARNRKIDNVQFLGSLKPHQVAAEMQRADLFFLTSQAEGVPKVVQEAAACGLPIVLFGHYGAPTVVHGENGMVVWTDSEMSDAIGELLADPDRARKMGQDSQVKSQAWDWEVLAPVWEERILELVDQLSQGRQRTIGRN